VATIFQIIITIGVVASTNIKAAMTQVLASTRVNISSKRYKSETVIGHIPRMTTQTTMS